MRRGIGMRANWPRSQIINRTDDFNAQRARPAIQLFDTHKGPHGLRFGQNTLGHVLGQCLEQVQAFFGQFGGNGLCYTVIAEDSVDIVVQIVAHRAHLNHYVKADTLGDPALSLKCTYFDLDDVIAQRNAI